MNILFSLIISSLFSYLFFYRYDFWGDIKLTIIIFLITSLGFFLSFIMVSICNRGKIAILKYLWQEIKNKLISFHNIKNIFLLTLYIKILLLLLYFFIIPIPSQLVISLPIEIIGVFILLAPFIWVIKIFNNPIQYSNGDIIQYRSLNYILTSILLFSIYLIWIILPLLNLMKIIL